MKQRLGSVKARLTLPTPQIQPRGRGRGRGNVQGQGRGQWTPNTVQIQGFFSPRKSYKFSIHLVFFLMVASLTHYY